MTRLSLAFFIVAIGSTLVPACSSDTPTASRKCVDSIQAYARPADGSECGELRTLSLQVCQREPEQACASKASTLRCVGSPGNQGFLLVLDPCADVDSLPEGWQLPEFSDSAMPQYDCNLEKTVCGSTSGSGGSAGAGTGGAGGQ